MNEGAQYMMALAKGMAVLSDKKNLCKARGWLTIQKFEGRECFVTTELSFSHYAA